jgi:hypothetical protein
MAPGDHDLTDLVITATPAAPIMGVVVDQTGAPIPDATITIQNGNDRIISDSIVTDLDGRFRISNATAGNWQILVGPPPPVEAWREPVITQTLFGGDENVRIVAVREAIGRAEIVVEVLDGVTHSLLDPREAFCGERPDRPNVLEKARFADERAKGVVRLHRWKVGAWRLRVKCDGHASAYLDFDIGPTDSTVQLRIEVPPAARLTGHIVAPDLSSDELKKALESSHVRVMSPDGRGFLEGEILPYVFSLHGSTDFRFDLVPNGPLTIGIAGGDVVGNARIDAKPGVEHSVEIRAVRAGRLRTLGAARLPAGDSHLALTSEDGFESWLGIGWPGRGPRDALSNLSPGRWRWRLFVRREGDDLATDPARESPMAEGALEIRAGETTELQLPGPPR